MFYCNDLLRKNDGKFAAIWLAAVYGKNIKKILTRRQIIRVDITQVCTDVVHPTIRFSLRLQSNLMLGILRVYREQVSQFCDDIKRAWRELRMTFHVDMRLIDLQKPILSEDACTLPDPLEHVRSFIDDFPKDIFSISPSDLFPKDDDTSEFFRVGFHSPASSTASRSPHTPPHPHTPPQVSPGPHQISKDKITMPEVEMPDHVDDIIKVPGEDTISPQLPPDDDDEMIDQQERPVPPADKELPPEKHDALVMDPNTGERIIPPDTGSKPEEQRPFSDDMVTPIARVEPVVPGRPHKRKRQPVDKIRKLTDEKIKRNHLTVMDTLRDRIIDVPLRLSAQELLNNPSLPALRSRPFIDFWRQNAVPRLIPDEEVPNLFGSDDSSSEQASEEPLEGQQNETSYERSHRSIPDGFIETPGSPTPGHEMSGPDVLRPGSSIDNIFISSFSADLSPIREMDREPEPHITQIQEDPEDEQEPLERVLQRLLAMGDRDETSFSEVSPPSDTEKATAAKRLFQLLEWHRQNVVVLSQPGAGFSEIFIERGSKFDSCIPEV